MVLLKEAWDSGANKWSERQRQDYANDLSSNLSLRTASSFSNRSKFGQDPGDWLPTNEGFISAYLDAWVSVKVRWKLSINEREHDAISKEVDRNYN